MAAVDQLGRTGARAYEVGYEEDTDPVVWNATVTYQGTKLWRSAADPVRATELLLEDVIDGGLCTSCGRPTALILDGQPSLDTPAVCERYRIGKRYVRSCS